MVAAVTCQHNDSSDTDVDKSMLPVTTAGTPAQLWTHTVFDNENRSITYWLRCFPHYTLCVCVLMCEGTCENQSLTLGGAPPCLLRQGLALVPGAHWLCRAGRPMCPGDPISTSPQPYAIPHLIFFLSSSYCVYALYRMSYSLRHIIPLINNLGVALLTWWPSLLTAQEGHS